MITATVPRPTQNERKETEDEPFSFDDNFLPPYLQSVFDSLNIRQEKKPEHKAEVKKEQNPSRDPVNHPTHYTGGGIETIDFIEAKQLNFCLGNVVKYVARAGHKDNKLEDLKKARWYLDREIENIEHPHD